MRQYASAWHSTVLLAAAIFVTIALLQSPLEELFLLVSAISLFGAAVQVTAPRSSRRARWQFRDGFVRMALLTLVIVGMGHHLTTGLLTVGLLSISAPWVARTLIGT